MFDFPAAPAEGQTFTPPGGPTYAYNSPRWRLVAIANDARVPEPPLDGFTYGRLVAPPETRDPGFESEWGRVAEDVFPPEDFYVRAYGVDVGPGGDGGYWLPLSSAAPITAEPVQDNLTLWGRFTGAQWRAAVARGGDTMTGGLAFAPEALSASTAVFDAYQEGVWTPSLTFGGLNTGITYTDRWGQFVRLGRLLLFSGRIILSSKGSASGNAMVGGLPYNGSYFGFGSIGHHSNFTGLLSVPYLLPQNTTFVLNQNNAGSVNAITATNFTNTTDIVFGGALLL